MIGLIQMAFTKTGVDAYWREDANGAKPEAAPSIEYGGPAGDFMSDAALRWIRDQPQDSLARPKPTRFGDSGATFSPHESPVSR